MLMAYPVHNDHGKRRLYCPRVECDIEVEGPTNPCYLCFATGGSLAPICSLPVVALA